MPRSCQMGAVTAFAPCRFRALAHRVSEATGLASLQHMPVDVVPYGLLISWRLLGTENWRSERTLATTKATSQGNGGDNSAG
mmetsp:Transcript_76166/g.158839  ORF Transcript_76166/g.158839 Transcript_76166/m.158839 type:complete len:82 (-) Transcript_76166:228-473(-)